MTADDYARRFVEESIVRQILTERQAQALEAELTNLLIGFVKAERARCAGVVAQERFELGNPQLIINRILFPHGNGPTGSAVVPAAPQ
jgi:hypothetical protein